MVIKIVPEMSPEDLEKVLKHLPEPKYVQVLLFGNFDYSSISNQAQEVVPGAKLVTGGGLIFRLEDASKKKILDIYRKSTELKAVKPSMQAGCPRRIDLHNVEWYLDNNVNINLTPWQINVKYPLQGLEPDYISAMRKELYSTNVDLKIEIGNR